MLAVLLAVLMMPVPPAPAILTEDLVQGRWRYGWGNCQDGWIRFWDDGTYCSQHYKDSGTYWTGIWYVTRANEIVLIEGQYKSKYVFELSMKSWPVLEGMSNGNVPVKLSERRP